ncbi:MAG: T9SS type A sorting domain-containing protein [Bacteroidia bacterium]
MKTPTLILGLFLLFGFTSIMAQPLNGSYSIDAGMATGGTNYQTFNDAVSDLTANGISGNVIFNIASGTYTEQVTIPWISGTSPTDSIIFQSATGDSTDVVLTYNASSSANYTLQLDSTAYITFQNLTLRASNLTYGRVVLFTDYVKSIHFRNNHILGQDANAASNTILIYGNAIRGSHLEFSNNRIEEGANGIYLNFQGSSRGTHITIANNFILDNFSRGVDLTRINFLNIIGNKITTDDEATGYIGIYLFDIDSGIRVVGNNVYDVKNVALYLQFSENSSTDRGLIANNFFHARDNGDAVMLIRSNEYLDIFHNSVHRSDDANQDDYALEFQFGNNNRIWNNNIANTGGGPAIYYHRPGSLVSDYNNLYVPGCNLGRYTSPVSPFTDYAVAGLPEWQSVTGFDANSLNANPAFVNDTNLHSSSIALAGAGVYTGLVSEDIDGQPRNNPPAIGADEIIGQVPYSAGTYAVPNDFATIQAAADSFASYGISGHVVLNIAPGTYNEQVEFRYIPRASQNDSVIIQSSTQDSSDVIIEFTSIQSEANWTVMLKEVAGITLQYLTIRASGTTYGRALVFEKRMENINILNNLIVGPDVTIANTNASLFYGEDIFSAGNLRIKHNMIRGGSQGISLVFSNSTNCISGSTIVANNILKSNYNGGIFIENSYFLQLLKNTITSTHNYANYTGIELINNDSALAVIGNQVYNVMNHAMRLESSDNSPSARGLVSNNFFHSHGTGDGVVLINNQNLDIFHNSVHKSMNADVEDYAFVEQLGNNNRILNNIFANSGGGPAINYDRSDNLISDYNNFYSTACNLGRYYDLVITDPQYYGDLVEWQSITGLDSSSYAVHPAFLNDSDLHTTSFILNNAGTHTGRVPMDFDDEPRNNPPDIGADEFIPSGLGPYTTGSYAVPTDFLNIQSAVDSFTLRGIDGNVILNIEPGTYYEQVKISSIPTTSHLDSLVVQSATEDSADVTIEFAAASSDSNWTILLDNVSNLTLQHLTVRAIGTFKNVLVIKTLVQNVNILNSRLEGDLPIIGSEFTDKDFLIANNRLLGASSGIFLKMKSSEICRSSLNNTTIYNNSSNEIHVEGALNLKILNNKIAAGDNGITLHNTDSGLQVIGNYVYNVERTALEIRNTENHADKPGLVANNFLHSKGQGHTFLMFNNEFFDVFHNSVHLSGDTADSNKYAFTVQFDLNDRVLNNIFMNSSGGPVVWYDEVALLSDYNNFYGSPCIFGRFEDFDFPANLSAWQTTTGFDLNSYETDPKFLNDTDLHVTSLVLNGVGTPVSVTNDIDGEARANPPDIGADEFTPVGMPYAGGTYAVPTDFPSIQSAMDSFARHGIDGNVILNIAPGTYNEQIEIQFIYRASPEDSLIIQSSTGDSADVVIQSAFTPVVLKDVGALTLQHLTLRSTNSSTVIAFQKNLYRIKILNNLMESLGSTSIYGENFQASDILIANNKLNGVRFLINNTCAGLNTNVIIENNVSGSSITVDGINGLKIRDNVLTQGSLTLSNTDSGLMVTGNHVYNGHPALTINSSTNSLANRGLVANNFFHSSGSGHGMHIRLAEYLDLFHNSVNKTNNSNSNNYTLLIEFGSDNRIYNNIFVNSGGGRVMWYNEESSLISDYNNFYTTGSILGRYNDPFSFGVSFDADLSDWQSNFGGHDHNSFSVDPGFVNDTDLHVSATELNGTGITTNRVTVDFDKETRGIPPDIGADEFIGNCPGVVISFTIKNPSCHGDNDAYIKVYVTGGAAPYLFAWSHGQTGDSIGNLHPTRYFLTTTDTNGCKYFDTIDIINPEPLTITASITDASGAGTADGAIDLMPTGGTQPYSFLWSNNATSEDLSGIDRGTYKVVLTDSNGCQDSAEFLVEIISITPVVKISPSDSLGSARAGFSTAIHGDWAVAGAPLDTTYGPKSGAAYIYQKVGGSWTSYEKITSTSNQAGDKFGSAVGIDDTLAIIGAPEENSLGFGTGAAYVFARRNGAWVELQTLTAPAIKRGDFYGYDVAIFGDRIAIGSIGADLSGYSQSGAVYIYERTGGTWAHTHSLLPNDVNHNDYTGFSVDMYGDRVVAGSPTKNSGLLTKAGAAYVWKYDGAGNWVQESKLVSNDLDTRDSFGISVGIVDSSVIVGAYGDDDDGNNSGSAYIFQKGASTYSQTGKLTAGDGDANHLFGHSVGITRDTAIVGAYADDHSGIRSGSAYLFANSGGWGQFKKLVAPTPGAYEDYGFSVDASQDWAMVGAKGDGEVAALAGAVYFYHLPSVPTPIMVQNEENLFDNQGKEAEAGNDQAISANEITDEYNANLDRITVYPNPARDRHDINISIPEGKEAQVQIIDAAGNFVVNRFEYGPMKIHNLRAGVYFLRIQIDAHVVHRKIVVVK